MAEGESVRSCRSTKMHRLIQSFNIVTDTATRIAGVYRMVSMTLLEIIRQIQYKDLATDKNLTMDIRSGGIEPVPEYNRGCYG